MTNGLIQPPYSQNVWPGPPKELPPLMDSRTRFAYAMKFWGGEDDGKATVADLSAMWCDVGQRLAIAMREQK